MGPDLESAPNSSFRPPGMSEARRGWLLWAGLVMAFSPVIQNLGANLVYNSDDCYTLLSVVLVGVLLQKDSCSTAGTQPSVGMILLLLGFITQLVGIAASSWSIARGGLPIAMLGLSLAMGRPPALVMALSFALIPIPSFIQGATTPYVESMLATGAADFLSRLGSELDIGGPLLQFRGQRFELLPHDNGLVSAIVLAQVGWYRSVRQGSDASICAAHAGAWGLLAIVVQPLAVVVCVASLPLGVPGLGRFCLTHGIWLLCGGWVIVTYIRSTWPTKRLRVGDPRREN